jgi:outer membrane protein insertion porin family
LKIKILVLILPLLLSSCLGTKYLKRDESILYKQKIRTSSSLNAEEISPLISQTPNSHFIGLPIAHLVHVYKFGENIRDTARINVKIDKLDTKYSKKIAEAKSSARKTKLNSKKLTKQEKLKKKLNEGNQLMRLGEKLAVFDSSSTFISEKNIQNYLFSIGYFNALISTKAETNNQLTKVEYLIDAGKQFRIDSIIYQIADPKVDSLFHREISKSLLKKAKYEQSAFGAERDRVYEMLSNNGYYNFKRQYVQFEVDSTTLDDQRLIVRENIANPSVSEEHKVFRIDSVIFSNETIKSTRKNLIKNYNNITFNFSNDKYPERILAWRIFLEKDSLYSKELTLETQKQLSYLDVFKFVNINYDSSGGKFIANIFTSPLKKNETSTEVGLSVLDQAGALPGPFFNFNAKSRNVFGGLEIIQLSGNTSIQGIKSVSDQTNNYSRFQYGGELSVTFPQFLFPMKETLRASIGKYNPRTKISTGINFEDRISEYERTTFNGSMSYIWQVRDNSQFTLRPFDLSYIYSLTSNSFQQDLDILDSLGNKSLVSAFQSSFVSFSSISMNFNKNNYGLGNNNSRLLQAYLETAGNIENVFGNEPFGSDLEYYKYLKFNIDLRKINKLTSKSTLAYRLNVGAAFAYGSNLSLPYEKYFFAGGSNSVRAWQPRRLGPGSFAVYQSEVGTSDIIVDNRVERPGDIILESSIEYRRDLIGFVDYALFIDAGNIWLWNSRTIDNTSDGFGDGTNDDGVFRASTFLKEIAVGAGYGFRFDFSFLVLRIDFAYKIVNPAFPINERFILGDYQFKDLWDFRNKGAINIGIGYPF